MRNFQNQNNSHLKRVRNRTISLDPFQFNDISKRCYTASLTFTGGGILNRLKKAMFLKQQQQKNNVFFDSYGELKKEAAFLYTPRKDINHAFSER